MRGELTQAELEHEFYGDRPIVTAKFYDEDVLDVEASNKNGRRTNKSTVYVHLKCVQEESEFKRPATDADKKEHSRAWQAYLKEKEDGRPGQIQDSGIEEDCPRIGTGYAQTG